MKKLLLFGSLIFALLFVGCAGREIPMGINSDGYPRDVRDLEQKTSTELVEDSFYVPKDALMEPKYQVSRLYVREIAKMGIDHFTIIRFRIPETLVRIEGQWGEWPFIALLKDGRELKGKAFLYVVVSNQDGDDFWAEARIFCKKEELKDSKLLFMSRDSGFCYDLVNQKEKIRDLEKFDKSEEYRHLFYEEYGSDLPELSEEIKIGSKRWYEYVREEDELINAGKFVKYILPGNNEERISSLLPRVAKDSFTKINDWNDFARALKKAGKLSFGAASIFGYEMSVRIVLNVIEGVTSKERTGLFCRSRGPYHRRWWVNESVNQLVRNARQGDFINKPGISFFYNNQ